MPDSDHGYPTVTVIEGEDGYDTVRMENFIDDGEGNLAYAPEGVGPDTYALVPEGNIVDKVWACGVLETWTTSKYAINNVCGPNRRGGAGHDDCGEMLLVRPNETR